MSEMGLWFSSSDDYEWGGLHKSPGGIWGWLWKRFGLADQRGKPECGPGKSGLSIQCIYSYIFILIYIIFILHILRSALHCFFVLLYETKFGVLLYLQQTGCWMGPWPCSVKVYWAVLSYPSWHIFLFACETYSVDIQWHSFTLPLLHAILMNALLHVC